ncbi:MAG: hypothetical protein Q9219_000658 [cf. Caloplaca sp. 3 TL-2023]
MAPLLERTVAMKDSTESFHSSHSHQQASSSPKFTGPSDHGTEDLHSAALQAAGLPFCEIEAYLNDPRNKEILASPPIKSPPHKKPKIREDSSSSASCTPVQLGAPKTTHHVSALHQLCQERGLSAEFEIDGHQIGGFSGMVTVGGEIIANENRAESKKAAKERLAELAIPVVRDMPAAVQPKAEKGEKGEPEKNWVGFLLEYHNATDPTHSSSGPIYTEYALGLQFACTCTIPSCPSDTFGSSTVAFPNKKAARTNAAKEAIKHLVSIGEVNPDGSPKVRKKVKVGAGGPTVRVEANGVEVKRDATYAARVNDLAPLLSLTPPIYRLGPTNPSAPNLLSGAAYFSGDAAYIPRLKDAVGEVRNVFGKKNAKEECARGVWEALREVARERGVEIEAGE